MFQLTARTFRSSRSPNRWEQWSALCVNAVIEHTGRRSAATVSCCCCGAAGIKTTNRKWTVSVETEGGDVFWTRSPLKSSSIWCVPSRINTHMVSNWTGSGRPGPLVWFTAQLISVESAGSEEETPSEHLGGGWRSARCWFYTHMRFCHLWAHSNTIRFTAGPEPVTVAELQQNMWAVCNIICCNDEVRSEGVSRRCSVHMSQWHFQGFPSSRRSGSFCCWRSGDVCMQISSVLKTKEEEGLHDQTVTEQTWWHNRREAACTRYRFNNNFI